MPFFAQKSIFEGFPRVTVIWSAFVMPLLLLFGVISATMAGAIDGKTSALGPDKVIRIVTENIMALAIDAPSYFREEPERYFQAVGVELDKVVDFRGFSKGVMGQYASINRYESLDKRGQERLHDQLDRFSDVLRDSLIETYGRGLLAFGGSRVKSLEVEFSPTNVRVASVTQYILGDEGEKYTIRYQMGRYSDGNWRLRNMIIEGINLGEIYRGQFDLAVKEAGGELDLVINSWGDSR